MTSPGTALITGMTGFAGSHLADLLLAEGWRVAGTASPGGSRANIAHLGDRVQIIDCDVRDRERLLGIVKEVAPMAVFHLAAKTADKDTRLNPQAASDTNLLGTINLLDAILVTKLENTKILVAGSSAEYGQVNADENPITEDHPLRPVSTYGVTKIAQSMVALQYHLSHGLHIIRTRAFNHAGPRQSEHFAVAAFAKQIAEIEAGAKPPTMSVGDLSQERDLSDVRDIVRGYLAALLHGTPGEVYNIAAGSAVRTSDVLKQLSAMSTAKIEVTTDPARIRPGVVATQIGDAGKLTKQAGWRPRIPLERTLSDTLAFWRKRNSG